MPDDDVQSKGDPQNEPPPNLSTREEETAQSYTLEEVNTLVSKKQSEWQSSKDKEVTPLRDKIAELESLHGFAELDEDDRKDAVGLVAVKTNLVDGLVDLGVIDVSQKRFLMRSPTVKTMMEDLKEMTKGKAVGGNKEALETIRSGAAGERVRVPGATPPPSRNSRPPDDPAEFSKQWDQLRSGERRLA
jgi:hypothetical protein